MWIRENFLWIKCEKKKKDFCGEFNLTDRETCG